MSVFPRHQDREQRSASETRFSPLDRSKVERRLQRQALGHAIRHLLLLSCVFLGFNKIWPLATALRWLLQAVAVLGYVHFYLWRRLGQNHPPAGGRLFPVLGVANGITLARGWGISCLAGLIGLPVAGFHWASWVPGLLYLGIGGADYADGLWARRTRTESLLGRHLDMELDALGLLFASALAIDLARLPFFYLPVGLSYYLYNCGRWYRSQKGKPILPLRERPFARLTAGLQMGFVGVALLPLISAQVLNFAAIFFMTPLILGFIWDWMVVSGCLNERMDQQVQQALTSAAGVLAAVARLVLVICGPALVGTLGQALPTGLFLTGIVLWIMIVAGCLGRSAALGAGCLLAVSASIGTFSTMFMVALGAVLVVIMIGTGPWSWWRPEDACLAHKAGKPR